MLLCGLYRDNANLINLINLPNFLKFTKFPILPLFSLISPCPLSVLSPRLAREDFREVSERCQGDSKAGTIVALSLNSLISLTPISYLLSPISYLLTLPLGPIVPAVPVILNGVKNLKGNTTVHCWFRPRDS